MAMPHDFMTIGPASRLLGVSTQTLRLWDASGKFRAERTLTGQRVYRRADIERLRDERNQRMAIGMIEGELAHV
jgi:DNA-binding transcriptional MerR regulator